MKPAQTREEEDRIWQEHLRQQSKLRLDACEGRRLKAQAETDKEMESDRWVSWGNKWYFARIHPSSRKGCVEVHLYSPVSKDWGWMTYLKTNCR